MVWLFTAQPPTHAYPSMKTNLTIDQILGPGRAQIKRDLFTCFARFPIESLLHLRNHFDRLIRGAYRKNGGGCIFHLLSEMLPQPIQSRQDLIRHFTGQALDDCDAPVYLPAKHLVKIWDADLSHPHTAIRYPGVKKLTKRFLWAVLLEAIELRLSAAAKAERAAMARAPRELSVFELLGV
jgi:hypothetical protein